MADYVLVHGGDVATDTWNRLTKENKYPAGEQLGGKVWNNVAAILRSHGQLVVSGTGLRINKFLFKNKQNYGSI